MTRKGDWELRKCWYGSSGKPWLKAERPEVRGGAKGNDERGKFFDSIVGIVELLDPVKNFPELREVIQVVVVDVDRE